MWHHRGVERLKLQKSVEKQHLIFGIIFLSCLAVFLWRCFFSINYYDEPYGIAAIWRFFKGGAILAEDWHPSQQLTAWVLYPVYWFWYTVLGGNDGIMLGFRITYVVFQGIIACYCYYRLRKYNYFGAAAALLFMFSTHNNMTTLNYNTIGIGCMMVLVTTLFTEENYQRTTLFLCGVLAAVIVLAQPFTIFIFLLWGLAVGISSIFKRKESLPQLLRIDHFIYIGLGAAFVLMLFLAVIFSRASGKELLTGIYFNLNDPEHRMDISYKVLKYFERFYRYYKYQIVFIFVSILIGFFKKGRISDILRSACWCFSTGILIYYLIYHGWISDYVPIDFLSVPMAFYGISVFALGRKKDWKLFFCWILPALMYSFCVQLATDTGILAVSAATIIASAGGIILVCQAFFTERAYLPMTFEKCIMGILVAVFLLQAGLLIRQRIIFTWWSAPVQECTEIVTQGPAKGIRTSVEDLVWYENALKEIDSLELTESDRLLIFEHASWLYLYADVPVATYSFWSVGEENFLDEYYEVFPDKYPTVIYTSDVEDAVNRSYIKKFLEEGYQLTTYASENISLQKYIRK